MESFPFQRDNLEELYLLDLMTDTPKWRKTAQGRLFSTTSPTIFALKCNPYKSEHSVSAPKQTDEHKIIQVKYFKNILGCQVFERTFHWRPLQLIGWDLGPTVCDTAGFRNGWFWNSTANAVVHSWTRRPVNAIPMDKYWPPIRDKNLFFRLFHRICDIFKISFGVNIPERQVVFFFVFKKIKKKKKKRQRWKPQPRVSAQPPVYFLWMENKDWEYHLLYR